jgi:hypothetical protein
MRPGSVVGPQQNWLEQVEPLVKSISLTHVLKSATMNDGTDMLADTTIGMKVPVQPRKDQKRHP